MQDLDLIPRRTIVLANLDSIVPCWLRITCAPRNQDWNVKGIEYYDTEHDAMVGEHKGFQSEVDFDKLPPSAQLQVHGHLNQWEHGERERNLMESRLKYEAKVFGMVMGALTGGTR